MHRKIEKPSTLTQSEQAKLVSFLSTHLEQFGDQPEDIDRCIEYAKNDHRGGFIYLSESEDQVLQGVSVVLKTHMDGFIPPYILVYIAVDGTMRGKGIGRKLVEFIQNDLNQPIALHVETENPAKRLYERLGFTNKYLEMRWTPHGLS